MSVRVMRSKSMWKTIDEISYDVRPGLELLFSFVILLVASLLIALFISGEWRKLWEALFTLTVAGIGVSKLVWAVRRMGKSVGMALLYTNTVQKPPLPEYEMKAGAFRKINLNYPVKPSYVAIYFIYNVLYTIVSFFIYREFMAHVSYSLIFILISAVCLLIYLYIKNNKLLQYVYSLPYVRELFILLYIPFGIMENGFIYWYRRFIKMEIDQIFLHPDDSVNVFFNIPRKLHPLRLSISLECDEIADDHAYSIYSERLFDFDHRCDTYRYLDERDVTFIMPSDVQSSFEAEHNSIVWYFSYKLYFKYIKWLEWGFPVCVVPRGVTMDML